MHQHSNNEIYIYIFTVYIHIYTVYSIYIYIHCIYTYIYIYISTQNRIGFLYIIYTRTTLSVIFKHMYIFTCM